jgi:hypothetical protein
MEWCYARCSIERFDGKPHRSISAPTTLLCIDSTSGRPTSHYSKVTEIKTVPYVPLPIRLSSGLSERHAESAWTVRCSGRRPIWRRSCSISNTTITSIKRTKDGKGTRRNRASKQVAHEQVSVAIGGRSIAEAYTKRP